jgi:hypothetical protein
MGAVTMPGNSRAALAALARCRQALRFAHIDAEMLVPLLIGARADRADELASTIADAEAFCKRLNFLIEGDCRAELPVNVNRDRDKTCSVEGCPFPVKASGLCSAHLQRVYRHGDPLANKPITHHRADKKGNSQ